MDRPFKTTICLSVLATFFVSLFLLYEIALTYQQAKGQFLNDIQNMFEHAIGVESKDKVSNTGLFVGLFYNRKDTSKYFTIETGEGRTYIDKSDLMSERTVAETNERALQTYLNKVNPIDPVVLDSVFTTLLAKNVHFSHTAVRYKDNKTGRVLYSISDTTFLKSAYNTGEVLTGIENEISLQGYVFVSWWEIAREEKGHILRLLLVWILVVGSVCVSFIIFRRKMKKTIPAPSPISCSPEQVVIRLTPELYWDIDLAKLMRNGEIVVPLTAQCTQMMILFLEKPGHFVSRDELFDLIASGKDTLGAKDRLDQAIRRFRKSLEAVPEIRVENDRGKGYVLTIFSETSEDVVKQCVNNDLEVRGD